MSGAPEVYQASRIKRSRATKSGLCGAEHGSMRSPTRSGRRPCGGCTTQASVHGIVEKTEPGYGKVQVDLVRLRRAGVLPYGWITDIPDCNASHGHTTVSPMRWNRRRILPQGTLACGGAMSRCG